MSSQSSPRLQFYFNRNCPYAQRSWITLLELGVHFEPIEIELGTDNKTDWFLALNPNGKVPVIKHGSTIVYESLVVNEYLNEVFDGQLLPLEPGARAWARVLMSRTDSYLVKFSYSYLSHNRTEDADKDEQLKHQLVEELRFLDGAIAQREGTYFLGEHFSLADIAYIPFFQRATVALAAFKNLEMEHLNLPHLNTWLETMNSRRSCIETAMEPQKIQELYARFLKINYFQKAGVAS